MLIKAFRIVLKNFPNFKLIIIGKGREKKKLLLDIRKYNLNKNVKILDFRNPHKFYENAKLFILSSYFEGLPNVLLEAMSYKLPIVSSNCLSGPKEILKDGKYGYLFKVNDVNDCSKKIQTALKNYKKSKNMANKGFQNLRNLTNEGQCEKYLSYLDNLF